MSKQLSKTQKITLCAMLLVLDIVATHIIRTPAIGSLPFLRMSLGPSLIIFSSLLLGPFYGAIVGGVGDLLGIFLFTGLEGQINFLITIVYTLLGILPWALEKLTKRFRKYLQKPYFLFASMTILLVILICLFYVFPSSKEYFENGFGELTSWIEPLLLSLTAFFDLASAFALFFTNQFFQKKQEQFKELPSPYEVALICLVCEVVLMILLKPLAFYLFYNFLADSIWPIGYGTLFSCMFVFSSINILLNTFLTYWLLVFTRKYLIKNSN